MDIDPFVLLKGKIVDPIEELPLETVSAPLETDVLFGRDKIMFNHLGNVKFRLVIQSRAKEYEHAPSRRVKSSIVYSVVQNVHGYGGRFLKKEKDKTWKVVTVTEAIQKVGHALRDKKQHDHKMKAREIADARDGISQAPHLLTAKNKSVEGGCDLLLKLGEVCAKEIGVSHQASMYPGQESANNRLGHQGSNYPDQESVNDRRGMIPRSPNQAAKRPLPRSRGNGSALSTKKHKMLHEQNEEDSSSEDEDAAKCILALGSSPAAVATKPMEVRSSSYQLPPIAPRKSVHESWPAHGDRTMGPPPGVEPKMPPPVMNPAMGLDSRSDPLFLVQQRAQQMAQQQAQRLAGNHRAERMASRGHPSILLPPPPQPQPPINNNPVFPQEARASMQARRMNHQMSSLMQAAAGIIPRMGGFSFANAPTVPSRRGRNQRNAGDDREASRPVTPPPIIHTDSKDDDGHWIFYPIKVPNLKLAGKGWKLALMPIDGKGQPIELDPTNIQFPEV